MKRIFPLFIFFILTVTSCSDSGNKAKSSRFLPSSMGGFDQVIVIIDDNLKKSDVGDTLKKYLGVSYEILYRPEPLMDISYVDISSFKNFITRSRNILFLGIKSGTDPTSKFIQGTLGVENINKISGQPGNPHQFRKDVWARNQMVGFVIAEDTESMKAIIAEHSSNWIKRFMDSDLPEYREFTYMAGVNGSLKKQLKDYYQVQLDVPSDYKLAQNEDGFIWLRRDEPAITMNIMIDIKNIKEGQPAFRNRGILRRNQLGLAHVSSDMQGSYMSTDSTLGFVQNYSIVNNHPRYENRGLWRMENDFKGGPFLNYYIHDTKNNRIIFLEGFVYGPSEDKKPLMRQFETIFSTFKIL